MILITAVDDNMGMAFNCRRQSRDLALRREIISLSSGSAVWMNEYSLRQFGEEAAEADIRVCDDFLFKAGEGEFCFAENVSVSKAASRAEKIILFFWNRTYPADIYFDIDLSSGWVLAESGSFAGNSHEKITKEVFVRE